MLILPKKNRKKKLFKKNFAGIAFIAMSALVFMYSKFGLWLNAEAAFRNPGIELASRRNIPERNRSSLT